MEHKLGPAALWFADAGVPVFPLHPGSKLPATRHGFKDATTDPDQITTWWTARPTANIGLVTGVIFDAFDIDGPTGQRSRLEHWCYDADCRHAGNQPRPPDGWTPICDHPGMFNRVEAVALGRISTPRQGGMHLYVPPGFGQHGNGANVLPGIDYRGLGGYVVAPPSVITEEWAEQNEATAGTYLFLGAPRLES